MPREKTSQPRVNVASVRDRDELVAELWANDTQIAELARIDGRLVLQLSGPQRPDGWIFEYGDFATALEKMKRELER